MEGHQVNDNDVLDLSEDQYHQMWKGLLVPRLLQGHFQNLQGIKVSFGTHFQ